MPSARAMDPPRPRPFTTRPRLSARSLTASYSSSLTWRSATRLSASRADWLPIVLPSPGSTSSSRSPRSSSLASGVANVAESVTGAYCRAPSFAAGAVFCLPRAGDGWLCSGCMKTIQETPEPAVAYGKINCAARDLMDSDQWQRKHSADEHWDLRLSSP